MGLKEQLQKTGLTEAEALIYEVLLKISPSSTGRIIKETNLQSSTIYHCVDSLISKGLVSFFTKNNIKYFQAESPETLKKFIEDKQKELGKVEKSIDPLIKTIVSSNIGEESGVRIFEGWRGITNAFFDCIKPLDSKDTIYVFTLSKYAGANKEQASYLINKLRDLRVKKKIKEKVIINESEKNTLGKEHEITPRTQVKYLPDNLSHPAVVHIYRDTILIAITSVKPLALVIKNKVMAESFKNYFHLLWKLARK
jgi:sugar-specific transcriptional regulator TrmB